MYRGYTRERLLSAAKEAADNAEQFLRDAEILGRTRSFRHACGLIAIAEEEMAKALVLAFCATGMLAHRGWFHLAFQKHKDKHVAMSVVAVLSRLRRLYRGAMPTRQLVTEKAKSDSFMKLLDRTGELLRRPEFLARQFAGLLGELRTLAELQRIRERAFYLDLKPAPSRDICAKEFRRLLKMAREHQASVEWGEFVGAQARASLDKMQGTMTEGRTRGRTRDSHPISGSFGTSWQIPPAPIDQLTANSRQLAASDGPSGSYVVHSYIAVSSIVRRLRQR